jgi:hypothetical protein
LVSDTNGSIWSKISGNSSNTPTRGSYPL